LRTDGSNAKEAGTGAAAPTLEHPYLVPNNNGKTGRYDVQFQMGYKRLNEPLYAVTIINTI